jgi:hypothetical protein
MLAAPVFEELGPVQHHCRNCQVESINRALTEFKYRHNSSLGII